MQTRNDITCRRTAPKHRLMFESQWSRLLFVIPMSHIMTWSRTLCSSRSLVLQVLMSQPLTGSQRSRLILMSLFPNALTHTTSVCILPSPNYSAGLLSDNISHDSKAATPAEFSASIQIAPSSSLLWGDTVRPVGTVSPSSIVAATPCKRRLITSGTGSSNVNTPASLRSGDMHQQNLLHLIQRGAYVSSTITDGISPHSMGTAEQSMRTNQTLLHILSITSAFTLYS